MKAAGSCSGSCPDTCGLVLLLPIVSVLLLTWPCNGAPFPLRRGWSFSADLSLASPLPQNAYTPLYTSLFTPILASSNFSFTKGFALGFYSQFSTSSSSPSAASIFLSVCLGTNATDVSGRAFAVPVWKWPQEGHLTQSGITGKISLAVEDSIGKNRGSDSDLVLRDGDGSETWRVENVFAMELQENGNWALYNSPDKVAWESFDHPGDTLLQGQKLYVGMKGKSNNSQFAMDMHPGGLLLYMNSEAPSPLYYWGFPANTSALSNYVLTQFLNLSRTPSVNLTASFLSYACSVSGIRPSTSLIGGNITVNGGCATSQWPFYWNSLGNNTYAPDFVQLDNNGGLVGFTYLHGGGGENLLFTDMGTASTCLTPNACGPYGICIANSLGVKSSCSCPSAVNDPRLSRVFQSINPTDSSQGCRRVEPLRCEAAANITFVPIREASVTPIHFLYETNYMNNTLPLQKCSARCASNCSCAGFLYASAASFCLPFSDTIGLSNFSFVDVHSADFSVYVKLQHRVSASLNDASARSTQSRAHASKPLAFGIGAAIAAVIILLSSCVVVFKYRARAWNRKYALEVESDAGEEDVQVVLPMLPVRYTYKELLEATQGFSTILGRGAHSCVYEGVLTDGRRVAVKRLDQVSPRKKQFLAEVATIGGMNHNNIVHLQGFCSQRSKRLLVYEHMENGSLDRWLFGRRAERLLSWRARFGVAVGAARGLAYLHGDCVRPIVHFDVKPENILLDDSFVPKVADFGLSKLMEGEASSVMTGVRGTPGYLAPEWLANAAVSGKCDVYSYGMVLFELVGGRRNAVQVLAGSDEGYFPTWAAVKGQEGRILDVVDPRLEGRFDEQQVKVVLHVAFLCIQWDPNTRPAMATVCKMLEGLLPLGDEVPYSAALLLQEPISPDADQSFASGSILIEGR